MKIINAFNSQLELFSEEGYADFSGNSIRTIRSERSAGRGPAFVKFGKTTARRLLCRAGVLCGRTEFGLGHGTGAHAPDEYYLIDSTNPKCRDRTGRSPRSWSVGTRSLSH